MLGSVNAYNTNLKVNQVALRYLRMLFVCFPSVIVVVGLVVIIAVVGVYANSRPASCVLGQRQKKIPRECTSTCIIYIHECMNISPV